MSSQQRPLPAHDTSAPDDDRGAFARRIQCEPARETRDFPHAPRRGRPRLPSSQPPHVTRQPEDDRDDA